MALNHITVYGRFTKDPEVRYTSTGKAVASFTVAVDRDGKDTGTDFINCVSWAEQAEFVKKYFFKGSACVVTGRLQIRDYEDKNGNKRTAAEIVTNRVYFAGDKKTGEPVKPKEAEGHFQPLPDDDGELPF